jgi:L,D-transpeptidase YcbB
MRSKGLRRLGRLKWLSRKVLAVGSVGAFGFVCLALLGLPECVDRVAPDDVTALIQAQIDGRDAALGPLTATELSDLDALYRPGGYQPLWFDAAGRPDRNARDALTLLHGAADDGLDPREYEQNQVGRLDASLNDQLPLSSLDLAHGDAALSAGMLRYLRHLHIGRVDPRTIGFRLIFPPDHHDFAALLLAAIADRRIIEAAADLRPPLAQYRALRAMLARYRTLAADTTLGTPPLAASVRPGDRYEGAGILRHLLVAFDDLPPDTPSLVESTRYDDVLANGVRRFQIRHGLEPDGVLGRGTLAALGVPLKWRVRQIELALERLRWLPHLGGERLVAINIPMFRLWAWDAIPPNGAPLFGMDVIVGRALNTQTPVFVEEMREVIFRPYWNVPRSILRH